jgi:hypothetical protein
MALPDFFAIRAAIVQKLMADGTLMGLMTDGVAWDIAPQNATKFVKLSLADSTRAGMFAEPAVAGSGVAYEEATYLILAVALASSGVDVRQAALRIEALLDNQPLTVANYTWMETTIDRHVDITTVDPSDASIRWQSRGGYYRVRMTPT